MRTPTCSCRLASQTPHARAGACVAGAGELHPFSAHPCPRSAAATAFPLLQAWALRPPQNAALVPMACRYLATRRSFVCTPSSDAARVWQVICAADSTPTVAEESLRRQAPARLPRHGRPPRLLGRLCASFAPIARQVRDGGGAGGGLTRAAGGGTSRHRYRTRPPGRTERSGRCDGRLSVRTCVAVRGACTT